MTNCFPQANELTVADFQKHFHRDGQCCASNLQNGLSLQCDAIMGFLCRAAEQGCKTQIDNPSPLGICHMSKTACMILETQNTSANPHWDEDKVELPPTAIVTATAPKSRHNATTISFFTGFCKAFKFMMEHETANNGCERWAQKSLTDFWTTLIQCFAIQCHLPRNETTTSQKNKTHVCVKCQNNTHHSHIHAFTCVLQSRIRNTHCSMGGCEGRTDGTHTLPDMHDTRQQTADSRQQTADSLTHTSILIDIALCIRIRSQDRGSSHCSQLQGPST